MSVLTRLVKLEKAKRWVAKALRPKFTEEQYQADIADLLEPWPDLLAWLYGDPGGPRPDPHRLAAFICETAGMTRSAGRGYGADAKVVLPSLRHAAWSVVCFNISIQRFLDWGASEPPSDGPANTMFNAWYQDQLALDPVSKQLADIFFHVWNANDPDDPTEKPQVWTLAGTPECDTACPDYWGGMSYSNGGHVEPREWQTYDQGREWAKAVIVAEQLAAADLARAEAKA